MVRLAVLSDIHGNLQALEAVLRDVEDQYIDGYIVAGDSTGIPSPMKVMQRVRSLDPWIIKGNHEDYMLRYYQENDTDYHRKNPAFVSLYWAYQQLDDATMEYISTLPYEITVDINDTDPIRVFHGSFNRPSTAIVPDFDSVFIDSIQDSDSLKTYKYITVSEAFSRISEPVLIAGHTHKQWHIKDDGKLFVNPGSVGFSHKGPNADYCILEWDGSSWNADLRTVKYDSGPLREVYLHSGVLKDGGAFARGCLLSIESVTGTRVLSLFLRHVKNTATSRGIYSEQVPISVWSVAEDSFDWEKYEKRG